MEIKWMRVKQEVDFLCQQRVENALISIETRTNS